MTAKTISVLDYDFYDDHLEGKYVVITVGKIWGPFLTMKQAVEFCEKRQFMKQDIHYIPCGEDEYDR